MTYLASLCPVLRTLTWSSQPRQLGALHAVWENLGTVPVPSEGPVVAELQFLLGNGVLDLSGLEGLEAVITQSGFFFCM